MSVQMDTNLVCLPVVKGFAGSWAKQIALVLLACLLPIESTCQAQLFGSGRQLGQPLGRRQGTGRVANETQGAGEVQGNERFLRNNRNRASFVGSDRFERRRFVGSQQGTTNGPVVPSTIGVRPNIDRSRQINQPLPRVPRDAAYYPRLDISGSVTATAGVRFPGDLKRELENPDYFSSENRYEVLVVGRLAILRGVVADASQRNLAELLVSFEPGISEVRNELQLDRSTEELNTPPTPTADLPNSSAASDPPPRPEPPLAREEKEAAN